MPESVSIHLIEMEAGHGVVHIHVPRSPWSFSPFTLRPRTSHRKQTRQARSPFRLRSGDTETTVLQASTPVVAGRWRSSTEEACVTFKRKKQGAKEQEPPHAKWRGATRVTPRSHGDRLEQETNGDAGGMRRERPNSCFCMESKLFPRGG